MFWSLNISCAKNIYLYIFCMYHVTKLPVWGLEPPDGVIIRSKWEQELFELFLLLFYVFGPIDLSAWWFRTRT